MLIEEIVGIDTWEHIQSDILSIMGQMRSKTFTNKDFAAIGKDVMRLVTRLRDLADTNPQAYGEYDKLGMFLKAKLDLAGEDQPLDYHVIADVLRRVYAKIIKHHITDRKKLMSPPETPTEAKSKIQNLAILIHDESKDQDIQTMSAAIARHTAKLSTKPT